MSNMTAQRNALQEHEKFTIIAYVYCGLLAREINEKFGQSHAVILLF